MTDLALQAYTEYKNEFDNLLNSLKNAIDNNEIPKAKDFLFPNSNKINQKIKRPPNSNIIYTNQLLFKFGLLNTTKKFCDKHNINKQKLVPISRKVSMILWNELSDQHQEFFKVLASEVGAEHKKLYPNYKYLPKRKERKAGFTYKTYESNKYAT